MREQKLPEWMKIEIGHMLQEGVSDEGIQAVVEDWKMQMAINPFATYAAFVEYGLPHIDPSKVVEGSLVKADTDQPMTMKQLAVTLDKISQPTKAEEMPLPFDPDDYPVL